MNLSYKNSKQCSYWFFHPNLGEAIERHKLGQILEPNIEALRAWELTLEKDDNDHPIKPEIDLITVDVTGHLEKQINDYLNKNSEEAISDILFDPESKTISFDESAKKERAKAEALSVMKTERDRRIIEVEWMFSRHARENRLQMKTTLTESQIKELHTYINTLCDLPVNTTDPFNPEWPVKPSFT